MFELIELTDSGDLSRHFTSTVKGCRVTASSFGVLSKERVMMRLEKLSCIEVETGEVMVADVDGYVSGEDGKLGLRGTVVDRAGDHVRAAMVGGFANHQEPEAFRAGPVGCGQGLHITVVDARVGLEHVFGDLSVNFISGAYLQLIEPVEYVKFGDGQFIHPVDHA